MESIYGVLEWLDPKGIVGATLTQLTTTTLVTSLKSIRLLLPPWNTSEKMSTASGQRS